MLIILLLLLSLIEVGHIYRSFKKKHLLFNNRFSQTMIMAITMISSFTIALYLALLLTASPNFFYLLPPLIGLTIGWKFGDILQAPAVLNGIYNGALGGLMGTMFGAVLLNPALCNIPIDSQTMIATNMYIISIFVGCLHTLTCALIRYSFIV